MTTRTNNTAVARPRADGSEDRRARRYWGSMEPPTAKADFFSAVTAPSADGDGSVATIRMYGPIDSYGGWWGISTEDLARVLDALPSSVEQIILRINSPGGEVWEAMAILNMLGAHRARVTAVVDGLAASAASFIAAGCDETVMSRGSQMMIHSPSIISWGNAGDMRKTADFLDKLEQSVIEVYTDKAGEQDWATLLAAETWLTANETVALGLADRVDTVSNDGVVSSVGETDEASLVVIVANDDPEDTVNARVQAAAASARATAPKPPSSSEPGNPIRKENVVANDDPQAGANERLGTTDADTSEETAPAATAAATSPAPANTAPTAGLPEGIVAVDATVWAETQRNARLGAEARAEQDRSRRDGIIATALADGRISPTSRDHFRTMLDSDEAGATAALASLQKNTALPVDEIGNAIGEPDNSAYPAHWKR